MAREAFRPTPGDRGHMHNIPTEGVDAVTVDLTKKGAEAIEIIDDTPEKDRGKDTEWRGPSNLEEEEADLRGISSRTQKRIARMKAEIETTRRSGEAAQRERDAAIDLIRQKDEEIARMRKGADAGATALATSMKAEREARVADATRRLEQAHADGDAAAIAKATADLSIANAELVQIVARTPAPRAEPEKPQAQQQQPQMQQPRAELKPNVAAYIAHHSNWFNIDKQKTELAFSIHRTLMARGVRDDSAEYTRELDKGLKAVYPDHMPYEADDSSERGNGTTPRRTNAAERGSRDDGVGRELPRNKVELTASEVALAKRLGVSLDRYAAEKQKREDRMGAR